MKKLNLISVVFAFFLLTGTINAQNTCISDVTHTADASAVLDVYSTTRGMLVPRMNTAPASPATGLLYYDTGSNSYKYYNGTAWTELSYGSLWSRSGTDTYLTNLGDNAVIGTNANPFGYKFYVHQAGPGLISNSRIDGQLEIWDYTGPGNLMLGDINDNGGANGIMQLYFGGNAGIRLLANGNSYLNGGWIGIGVPMAFAPSTNVHLFDNFANPMPQFLIDQPGLGNSSVGYGIPGRNYAVGLVQDLQQGTDNNYKICDGPMLTPPLNYLDPFTMMEIHNENAQPGIIDFNHQSRARAYQGQNPNKPIGWGQPIPGSIWTPVDFDNIVYDEHIEFTLFPAGGVYSGGGGPAQAYFTVLEEGYYQVNARTDFILKDYDYEEEIYYPLDSGYVSIAVVITNAAGVTFMYAQGNKLQGVYQRSVGEFGTLPNNLAPNVSDVVYLKQGEQIEIWVWQSIWNGFGGAGGAIPLRVGPNNEPGLAPEPVPSQTYVSIHKSS